MRLPLTLVLPLMFLLPPLHAEENPWQEEVADAVARARQADSIAAYADALDVTYRADDWRAARELVGQASRRFADAPMLRGRLARALFRAGDMRGAERIAGDIPLDASEPIGLRMVVQTALAQRNATRALDAAKQLERLATPTAEDLMLIFAARQAADTLREPAALLRKAVALSDPAHGYPEIYFADALDGMPEFYDLVGQRPLNLIKRHGKAPMTKAALIGLPICMLTINGAGPYPFMLDTGGSIAISIDHELAEEIGIELLAKATIHGVTGKETSHQAVLKEVRLGDIVCEQVFAHVFDVPDAIGAGIIGTGVFERGRMTMDFANAEITVGPTSSTVAPGAELDLRIIADSKLMPIIEAHGRTVTALLDSGADGLFLSPSLMRDLFPDHNLIEAKTDQFGGGAVGVGAGSTPSIVIGPGVDITLPGKTYKAASGVAIDTLDDTLSPMLGVQTDVLIGMSALNDSRSATIDFPAGRMWIDWLPED